MVIYKHGRQIRQSRDHPIRPVPDDITGRKKQHVFEFMKEPSLLCWPLNPSNLDSPNPKWHSRSNSSDWFSQMHCNYGLNRSQLSGASGWRVCSYQHHVGEERLSSSRQNIIPRLLFIGYMYWGSFANIHARITIYSWSIRNPTKSFFYHELAWQIVVVYVYRNVGIVISVYKKHTCK